MDVAIDGPSEQQGVEESAAPARQRSPPARPRQAPGDTGHTSDDEEESTSQLPSGSVGNQTWTMDMDVSWASSCVVSPRPPWKGSISDGVGSYTVGNVQSDDVKVGRKEYRNLLHALRWFFPVRLMSVCFSMGAMGAAFAQMLSAAAFNPLLAELSKQGCSTGVISVWFSDIESAYAIDAVVNSLLNVQLLIPAFIHQRQFKKESYAVLARALCTMTLCLLVANGVLTFIESQHISGAFGAVVIACWATLSCAGPVTCVYFHMRSAEETEGSSCEHAFLVMCVVLRVVGTSAFLGGFESAGYVVNFIVAFVAVWLVLFWQRHPGQRGFSGRVLLGYANCTLASSFLIIWSTQMRDLGQSLTLVFWVATALIAKSFVTTLAENCVPKAWVACAVLPYCMVEDLIPILIFGTSADLNVEFWISSGSLCLWEIVRDSPRLKERMITAVKSASARLNPCACCPSRCKRSSGFLGPLPSLGCATLVTFSGGGMAAEIMDEAAEAVGEQAAEAHRGQMALKLDVARCNMVSELCCAAFIPVVVLTAHGMDEYQIFSPKVALACFAMQLFSVAVATIINTRSLQKMEMALAQWGVSRFALACAGAYMAGMVGLMVHIQFKLRVAEELSRCTH